MGEGGINLRAAHNLNMSPRPRARSTGGGASASGSDARHGTPPDGGKCRPTLSFTTVGTPSEGGDTDVNTEYNLLIHDAMSAVKACSIFSGIEQAKPLGMNNSAGGAQAPYAQSDYKHAMNGAGHYVCGGNFWWQDPLYTPCPGVPMNVTRVEKMSANMFQEPAPYPVMMTIGMGTDTLPDEHFGALKRCTPEEFGHAFVLAVFRDIKAGVDESVLHAWRRVMLTVPYRFELHETREKVFFRAFALREEVVTTHAVVARTAFQRIYEIVRFKTMAEHDMGRPLSAEAVASVYRTRASSFGGDVYTAGFVDNALTVFERALKLPEVRNMIIKLEDSVGDKSPFNSITKLVGIVKRGKGIQNMRPEDVLIWIFGYITDLVSSGTYNAEELTVRVLTGETGKPGNSGMVSLAHLKLSLFRLFVEVLLPKAGMLPEATSLIEKKMYSHADYRNNYLSTSVEVEVDSAWQGTLPESGRMALTIIEDRPQGKGNKSPRDHIARE